MIARFFLTVTPGLEQLAVAELTEKFPGLAEAVVEKGGMTVEAPLELGLAFHYYLKIPSAILLRLSEFKCRDLPKLFNKCKAFHWEKYLLNAEFEISAASQKSRLLNEKRIISSVTEGIERRFAMQPPKKLKEKFAFEVQVRVFNDVVTLSLNLSGEPLFKRGYKILKGVAPLRENIAAALFYALWLESRGFDTLIDPLCGSGTLLLEAQGFNFKSHSRSFAFENKADWQAMPLSPEPNTRLKNFYAFDRDKTSLQSLQVSREQLLSGEKTADSRWLIAQRDVFADDPLPEIVGARKAVIGNTPYGVRVKLALPPQKYYLQLFERLLVFKPDCVGLIVPKEYLRFLPEKISHYGRSRQIDFENGGLPVVFCIYRR